MSAFVAHPHHWITYKRLPWPVCAHCGLVRLKNDLTAFAVKHGCDHRDHPGYAAALAATRRQP